MTTNTELRAQLVSIREQVDAAIRAIDCDGSELEYELISESEARACQDAQYVCRSSTNQTWPSHGDEWGDIRYCVFSPNWEYRFRRPITKSEL